MLCNRQSGLFVDDPCIPGARQIFVGTPQVNQTFVLTFPAVFASCMVSESKQPCVCPLATLPLWHA